MEKGEGVSKRRRREEPEVVSKRGRKEGGQSRVAVKNVKKILPECCVVVGFYCKFVR